MHRLSLPTTANLNISTSCGLGFPDSQGYSFSIHRGEPLNAFAAATGRETRYRNPARDSVTRMLVAHDVRDGSWKVLSAGPAEPASLPGSFVDGRAAIAAVQAQFAAKWAEVAATPTQFAAPACKRKKFTIMIPFQMGNIVEASSALQR